MTAIEFPNAPANAAWSLLGNPWIIISLNKSPIPLASASDAAFFRACCMPASMPIVFALKFPSLANPACCFFSSSLLLPVSFDSKSKSLAYAAVRSCMSDADAASLRPDIIAMRCVSIMASPISSCVNPIFLSCIPYWLLLLAILPNEFRNVVAPP